MSTINTPNGPAGEPPRWISADQLRTLGALRERCANLGVALSIPLVSAEFHLRTARAALAEMDAELKALYIAVAGTDPWTDPDE